MVACLAKDLKRKKGGQHQQGNSSQLYRGALPSNFPPPRRGIKVTARHDGASRGLRILLLRFWMRQRLGSQSWALFCARGVIPADAAVPSRCISLSAEKGPCSAVPSLARLLGFALSKMVSRQPESFSEGHSNCDNLLLRSHPASGAALTGVAPSGPPELGSRPVSHQTFRAVQLPTQKFGRTNAVMEAGAGPWKCIHSGRPARLGRRAIRDAGHDAPIRPFA